MEDKLYSWQESLIMKFREEEAKEFFALSLKGDQFSETKILKIIM